MEITQQAAVGRCWAKLKRDCRDGRGAACRKACSCEIVGLLSLIGHSADVAAVLLALIQQPVIGRRLARLLGKPDLTLADYACLGALAALHDLGKVSQGFQHAPFQQTQQSRGHVEPLLALLQNKRGERAATRARERLLDAHGLGRLSVLLGEHGEWLPWQGALAHHGNLPAAGPATPELWQARPDHDPAAACRALVDAIETWFPAAFNGAHLHWNPRFGHAFAGLLTLADWLGSDETVFPMAGDCGAPDGPGRFSAWSVPQASALLVRRALAPSAARTACGALDWHITPLTGFAAASFGQAAMLALPPAPAEGRICLIEDETGSGKTEAALIHFLRLFDAGAVDGMYFALPTRAAAVQIHGRIERRLRLLLGDAAPPVVLAVPGYRDPAAEAAAPLPDESPLWPEGAVDATWASARSKRYLAACVAVGTIDQALMGALKVRHAHLRSAALLRLLLVVDEVHANDTYMTVILRRLLDQHRGAGGHALLMSATLGEAARPYLLQPHGAATVAAPEQAIATPYPAVWTDHAGLLPHDVARVGAEKSVEVILEPDWSDPAQAVTLAVEAAASGAKVLLIRNTVRDVVATQIALETVAPALSLRVGDVCAPHHARYAPEDRRRLDAALEAVLGSGIRQACGSVTITSQTAEQSLDIDADLLITDLCPADVLLQRIGRLHRGRSRVPVAGFEQPRVVLLAPSSADLAGALDKNGTVFGLPPLGLGLVYPDLLGSLATRNAFAQPGRVYIPRDCRRLVEAATHPVLLHALATELGGDWPLHWRRQAGVRAAHGGEAATACLEWDQAIQPLPRDMRFVTRLGLDDRLVELPADTVGPFGSVISGLTIPGRWVAGVSGDAVAGVDKPADGELLIALGGHTFVYDRLGLRRS